MNKSIEASKGVLKSSFTRPQAWQNCNLYVWVTINLFWHLAKASFTVQHFKCAYHLYQLTFSWNHAVLSCVFKSIPMPESLSVYKRFRKIRCQNTQHNTYTFSVSYRTKIPGTMNTLDLMWFIPSVISNIESRAYMVICLLTLFTSPTFIQVYIRFAQLFDFYTKS